MKQHIITICNGTSCINKGAVSLQHELESQLKQSGLTDKVKINISGCLGMCDKGPAMMVNEKVYTKLDPETAINILNEEVGCIYRTQ